MFATVASKTLYDRRRSLTGWAAGVATATVVLSALWPTIRDMEDLQVLLDSYPAELGNLFNIQAMTTPAGYLNAEFFSLLAPILFLTFGISFGARLPAEEEERGSLDVLLSLPVARWRVLLEQALTVVVAVALLGVAQLVGVMLGSLLFGMALPVGAMVSASAAMTLLGTEFGLVALAVGAATGRRALALATTSVLAVTSYLLYVAAQFVDALDRWVVLSPIEHVVGSEPILNGLPAVPTSATAAVAVAVVLMALAAFTRRDLATG
jgi:ABC-2 type transport system permease protein